MSGSYREAFPDVREWLGGPPGCPGEVGKPSRMSRSGRETLQKSLTVQEGLSTTFNPPGGPPIHSRPSWRASRPLLT